MIKTAFLVLVFTTSLLSACGGGGSVTDQENTTTNNTSLTLDQCNTTQQKFQYLSDIHTYTVMVTCANGANSCHNDEDPPPMHTVGLFWNMINMPCNTGIPEMIYWDQFCRSSADGGSNGVMVNPGDASNSYLIMRLRNDSRTFRPNMPLGVGTISPEEIYAIEAWINGLVLGVSTPSDPIDYSKTSCP